MVRDWSVKESIVLLHEFFNTSPRIYILFNLIDMSHLFFSLAKHVKRTGISHDPISSSELGVRKREKLSTSLIFVTFVLCISESDKK